MNSENFSVYLENPSHLYHITFQELKGLILQYPFCTHLHYLLAQKGIQEGHNQKTVWVNKASTYSPDRPHLFALLQNAHTPQISGAHYILNEDYLELAPLETEHREPILEADHHSSDSVSPDELQHLEQAFEFDEELSANNVTPDSAQSLPVDKEGGINTHKHPDEEPPNQEGMSLNKKGKSVFFIEDLIDEDLDEIIDAPDETSSTTSPDLEESISPQAESTPENHTEEETPQVHLDSGNTVDPTSSTEFSNNPEEESDEETGLTEIPVEEDEESILLEEQSESIFEEDLMEEPTSEVSDLMDATIDVPLDDLWVEETIEGLPEINAIEEEEEVSEEEHFIFEQDGEANIEQHLFTDEPKVAVEEANPVLEEEPAESQEEELPQTLEEETVPVFKSPSPSPKSHFSSWLQQFQSPQVKLNKANRAQQSTPKPTEEKTISKDKSSKKKLEEIAKRNKKSKKGKKESPKKFAARSLEEPTGIASEPLAKILAIQGSYQKAIDMYERLKLIFPKKSAYFADQIDELKKEL